MLQEWMNRCPLKPILLQTLEMALQSLLLHCHPSKVVIQFFWLNKEQIKQ